MQPWLLILAVAQPPVIPLRPGLTVVTAIRQADGDYESIKHIDTITAHDVRLTYSADLPDPSTGRPHTVHGTRAIALRDLATGRIYRTLFGEQDPETQPGTTAIGPSAAVLDDLHRTAHARLTIDNGGNAIASMIGSLLGAASKTGGQLSGTLARVETAPVSLPVLVNGERRQLPAVHARGRVGANGDSTVADLYILDDPANPLALKWTIGDDKLQVVKIDFDTEHQGAQSLERALGVDKHAVVYGIYFAFASDSIRPQSEPVLREIVDVMRRNPTWTLRIDGHTDNVGGDAANLTLSRNRALAVKRALVERGLDGTRLATEGFGAATPKEPNTTLEGRARNRRVELTRE
jgi:outer membrane protein OmpA-like peptidoglycan-associated protein